MKKATKKVEKTGPLYPPLPELDWLKDLSQGILNNEIWIGEDYQYRDGERLWNLYKYILWSRRYNLSERNSKERLVAYGFVVKYHGLVYDEPPNPANAKAIEMAKIGYRELKAER